MEAFRYQCGRLPSVMAGVLAAALLIGSAGSASAAARGGGDDYLLTSPTLAIDSVTRPEGTCDPVAATTAFTFTIKLFKPCPDPITVDFYTQDGTGPFGATSSGPNPDYVPVSTTLTIPPNTTSIQQTVYVYCDAVCEGEAEFFTVHLANASGGCDVTIVDDTGVGEIQDDDCPTSTLLQAFNALTGDDGITLRWQFTSAASFVDSWAERADAVAGPWNRVATEPRTEDGMVVMLDRNVASEQSYFYRLVAQLPSGELMHFGPIMAKAGAVAQEFALSNVWPTPSRGIARIEYALPQAAPVKLSVLDIQGREVAVLVDGVISAGRHQAVWHAARTSGTAPSGIYFVRYQTPGKNFVRRLIVTQ
jgi:hypothetical protein